MSESKTASDFSANTTSLYGINTKTFTLSIPERSNWTVQLLGNVYYTPEKNKEPNGFHRKMQELCFGVKWRKNK